MRENYFFLRNKFFCRRAAPFWSFGAGWSRRAAEAGRMNKPNDINDLGAIYRAMSEHEHQRELFSWVAAVALVGLEQATAWAHTHPQTLRRAALVTAGQAGDDRLAWLHSIPNGGSRGGDRAGRAREGARMRSEGVRRGIADVFLPSPQNFSGGLSGLYVELKKIGGKQSAEQKAFEAYCRQAGYGYVLAVGYLEAIGALRGYLESVSRH